MSGYKSLFSLQVSMVMKDSMIRGLNRAIRLRSLWCESQLCWNSDGLHHFSEISSVSASPFVNSDIINSGDRDQKKACK